MHILGIVYLGPREVLHPGFLHALEIEQALPAHTAIGMGVSIKFLIVKIKNGV